MPQIGRAMVFQVVARDNRANGGGINTATATVNVDGASGPFQITSQPAGTSYQQGSTQTVTWDVAVNDERSGECRDGQDLVFDGRRKHLPDNIGRHRE